MMMMMMMMMMRPPPLGNGRGNDRSFPRARVARRWRFNAKSHTQLVSPCTSSATSDWKLSASERRMSPRSQDEESPSA